MSEVTLSGVKPKVAFESGVVAVGSQNNAVGVVGYRLHIGGDNVAFSPVSEIVAVAVAVAVAVGFVLVGFDVDFVAVGFLLISIGFESDVVALRLENVADA